MSDIELVVKIDEEDYKKVLDTNNRDCEWNNMHSCYEAILNGTPLNEALDRIKAEIDLDTRIQVKHYTNTDAVIDTVLDTIDEYKEERE